MLDFESLIIYGSALLISYVFAYIYDLTKRNKYLFLSFVTIVLFCGLRYDVGFDYAGYVDIFYNIKYDLPTYVEPGFIFINQLFAKFNRGYVFVFLLMSTITYIIIFTLIKKYDNIHNYVFFLFVFQLLFQINNQCRQGLAIAIFYIALYYLQQKKKLKYVILILIGSLFHYSLILFLILIFYREINLKSRTWIILMFVSYCVSIVGIFNIVGEQLIAAIPHYEVYQNTVYSGATQLSSSTYIITLFWVLVGTVIAYYKDKVSVNKSLILNIYLLGITIYPLFATFHLIERVFYYPILLNFILAADLSRHRHSYVKYILVFMGLFVFIIYCLNNWGPFGGYPYYTVFGEHFKNIKL